MRKKNTLAIISAVLMIFVWTGAALAANTATMNVTSEPIRYQAVSDKGGGFTITFDAGTVLRGGDSITADLDLGVTIAAGQTIDLEISSGGSATPYAAVPIQGSGSPFEYTGAAPAVAGAGIYFRIFGQAGSQRITISVMGATTDTITVGPAAGVDSLILKFLNQGTNLAEYAGAPGIYMQGATPGLYDTNATLAANTLCINVSQFDENTVNANMDSADAITGADKFTFVPSNPQIAHVISAIDVNFEACFKSAPGRMSIGTGGISQGPGDDCFGFDNETPSGYCQNPVNNTMVIAASTPFDQAIYTVEMEILVNGASGDNGVYFSNTGLAAGTFDTAAQACAITTVSHSPLPITAYYLATGAPAAPEAPSSACTVAAAGRAVRMISAASNLGLVTTNDYLSFDLPWFNYALLQVQEGDVVSIAVTLTKVPCGIVFEGEWMLGTFGCPITPPTPTGCIYFPYFTAAGEADAYWDGIVITNMGLTDGMATITIYEADGDTATAMVTVNAQSQYVDLLSNIAWGPTIGTIGDASSYVMVNVSGSSSIDGFAMMARQDTGESMGYLPRCCMVGCN